MNNFSNPLSRQKFSCGRIVAGRAVCRREIRMPLPALARPLIDDPRIAPQPIADKGFASIRKIGNGLYATIADRSKGLQARCNGGFLIGRDAAIMVEGFQSTLGSAFQLETLRSRHAIARPRGDQYALALRPYAGQFGVWRRGNPHLGACRCARAHGGVLPKWQSQDLATYLDSVAEARERRQNRQPARTRQERHRRPYRNVQARQRNRSRAPNHALDPAKMPIQIDLGGLTVVIEHYIGHTDTDLIFRVPEQNTIYTGDLLTGGQYPVNINGYPSKWRETLAKFATFDKNTLFVPGHGQIMGLEGVAEMRSCFDDLAEHAEKSYKAGVPVEEAVEHYVVPDKFKNYRMFSWGFTIGRTYEQLYAEWSGKPVSSTELF